MQENPPDLAGDMSDPAAEAPTSWQDPRALKLYQLAPEFNRLMELIWNSEDPAAIEEVGIYLEQIQLAMETKMVGAIAITREMDLEADAIDAEVKRLSARSLALRNKSARLRAFVKMMMERANLAKVEDTRFTLTIRTNPPAVEVYEQADIPLEYVKTKILQDIDKAAIKKAIEAGEDIPGARLTRGTRLDVR